MPKVSAIISTYNSEKFIRGCLDDLLAQTLYRQGGLEIVVVVSGSQQGEEAIAKEYQAKHSNIVIKVTERESMYQAWNRGIEIASGDYLTNANTDDRHAPDALERLARDLDRFPNVSLTYGDIFLSNIENETFGQNSKTRVYRYPQFFAPASVLHYQFGPHPMWRKSVHSQIGGFSPTLKCAGDYDFNLRFALKLQAKHIGGMPTGLYLEHANALSFKDDQMRKETDALMGHYRQPQVIEELYKQAGAPVSSPKDRADIHTDMGIRALHFYPPWFSGNPHCEARFGLACFEQSTLRGEDTAVGLNNLGVLRAEFGDLMSGMTALRSAISLSPNQSETVHNIKELDEILKGAKTHGDLRYIHSGLSFPTQMELAGIVAGSK